MKANRMKMLSLNTLSLFLCGFIFTGRVKSFSLNSYTYNQYTQRHYTTNYRICYPHRNTCSEEQLLLSNNCCSKIVLNRKLQLQYFRKSKTAAFLAYNEQPNENENENENEIRIRLNKVFKATHSRREADKLISSGRVSVNGQRVSSKGGFYVVPHVDIVALDGKIVKGWEDMNAVENSNVNIDATAFNTISTSARSSSSKSNDDDDASDQRISNTQTRNERGQQMTKSHFEYIKYFKPVGVTCTTDKSVKGNIIDSIESNGYTSPHRIYPVGRLDKETSGLILLTSDGRVPNAVLRGMNKQPKVYKVEVDLDITDRDIQRLRDGIMITTVAQRDNRAKRLTQRTKPCGVERVNARVVKMTLMEGRNRQIRKMMGALGYTVTRLHRTNFMNISLNAGHVSRSKGQSGRVVKESTPSGLTRPGDWSFLDVEEMKLVENALQSARLAEKSMQRE